jgi:hypothetical protein
MCAPAVQTVVPRTLFTAELGCLLALVKQQPGLHYAVATGSPVEGNVSALLVALLVWYAAVY